tara:strand:+ start:564 stop:734 length:171 start_codon:yes stop_codon:yes gene_type:complete
MSMDRPVPTKQVEATPALRWRPSREPLESEELLESRVALERRKEVETWASADPMEE